MVSEQLLNAWNASDDKGSIQPPLTEFDIRALQALDIEPHTPLTYAHYSDVARAAFIACAHFRTLPNLYDGQTWEEEVAAREFAADVTAQTIAAFK